MPLTDSEMEVLHRLVHAEKTDRNVASTFNEAVEELGLDRQSVITKLATGGAVDVAGTAWERGSQTAEVVCVTPQGRQMLRERPAASGR